MARIMGLGLAAFIFWLSLVPLDLSVIGSLRLGDEVLLRGRVPEEDPRISAPRDPGWVHQGWLLDAGLSSLFKAHGPKGVILAKAGSVALAFVLLFSALGRKALSLASRALLVTGSFWLSHIGHFSPKSSADLLLTAILVSSLASGHDRKWRRWILVPLMAVWANVHWGFVVGLLLALVWLVSDLSEIWHGGRGRRPLLALILGIFLACLVTPHPLALFGALPGASVDWVAPHFHLSAPRWMLVAFFGVMTLALLSKRQCHRGVMLGWMVSFAGGVSNAEWIPLFGWMTGLAIGESLGSWVGWPRTAWRFPPGSGPRWAKAQGVVVWVATAALALSMARPQLGPRQWAFRSDSYPRSAMAAIKGRGPGQRVLNDVRYGDSLLAALYPSSKPFLLGEFGSASPGVYGDYLRLLPPPNPNWARRAGERAHHYYPAKGVHRGWRDVLERYGFDWALLSQESQLAQLLGREVGWHVAVAEEGSVLFQRGAQEGTGHRLERRGPIRWDEGSIARGLEALRIGNPFRALWHLKVPASQGDPSALLGSAKALLAMGRGDRALEALKAAREADSEGRMAAEIGQLEARIVGVHHPLGKGP